MRSDVSWCLLGVHYTLCPPAVSTGGAGLEAGDTRAPAP